MRDGYISVIICPLLATNEATEGPGGGHPMTADHAKPRHQSAHLQWLVLVIIQTLSKAETTNWKCLPLLSYCKCETLALFLMCVVYREWKPCLSRPTIKADYLMLFMFFWTISARLICIRF